MEYRTLGKTGLNVSALGFGGAPIGIADYLGHDNRDDPNFRRSAIDAIRLAVTSGINYFDTAAVYGDGRSETIMGSAVEGLRDKIVLSTKCPPNSATKTNKQRTDSFRASLDRLRTDHVDLLQLHGSWWDEARTEQVLKSDLIDWTDEMRRQKLTRFIGLTAEGPSGGLERLLQTRRFDVLQIAYNAIYQASCDYQREPLGVVPLAKSLGMGVTTMRTATSGVLQKLLRTEFPDIDLKRVTRLAINFVLSTPEIDSAIVGMKTPQEVSENVALANDVAKRIALRKIHNRMDGIPLA